MAFKSGEIYFVRERTDNSFGPYVKIGLVHGVRNSLTRLKEHQTGNPRSLYIDEKQVVKTEAVDRVEAQMHKIFAPKRVSGEWFDFPSEEELAEAISKARELAEEVSTLMPIFAAAAELYSQTSDSTVIPASPEALVLSEAIARAQGEQQICKTLSALIKSKLSAAIESDQGEVGEAAVLVTKTYQPKFMIEAFKLEHPELFEKYIRMIQAWKPIFDPKAKKFSREQLDQDFLEQADEIERQINEVNSVEEAYRLLEPQLLLTKLTARTTWDLEISLAKLKVLCGKHDGIEGVCSWKRQLASPKPSFDEELFVQENPELYLDYLAEAKTGTYIRLAKRKV